MRKFLQALSLLTRLPVRVDWEPELRWGELTGWFPAAGLAIGLILMAFVWVWTAVAEPFPLMTGALIVSLWAALTGAMHWDGWGDCADAFFTPVSTERRLEIMADPRLGSFGTIGLILLLACKVGAASYVASLSLGVAGFWKQVEALWPFAVAPVTARAVLVAIAADSRFPLARPGGMGAKVREGLGFGQVATAGATALLVAVLGGWRGVAMLLAAGVTGAGVAVLARRRIGGVTGDVLGAIVELGETAALLVVSLKG